jgi:ribose 5-phosphate isomerase B
MKLYIAADHAGFELKEKLKKTMTSIEWIDLGTTSVDSVDYPDFGNKLAREVLRNCHGDQRLAPCGVIICGSGVGISIAANRHAGIRAVLAESPLVAELSRQHNASNVLALGARIVSQQKAEEILRAWLTAKFEGGRHERRVQLLDQIKGEKT